MTTLAALGAPAAGGPDATRAAALQGVQVAIDARVSGNGPRSVGDTDDCVSVPLGGSVVVDIVAPSPGIPEGRGLSAYQFTLFYDPVVLQVDGDDPEQLLAAAAGSNVVPIADAKPDGDGVYKSWAVDFGADGIEPSGSSETGPGVLGRLTLSSRAGGLSPLVLRDIILADDASQPMAVEPVPIATIQVGQPCPGEEQVGLPSDPTPTPSPSATENPTPIPTPASSNPGGAGDPVGGSSEGSPGAFASAGGAPPAAGASLRLIVLGLAAMLGGLSLMGAPCFLRPARVVGLLRRNKHTAGRGR